MEQPWWKKILMSGAVWTALLAFSNGVVLFVWPGVPTNLLAMANALIGAILAAIGIGSVSVQVYKANKARQFAEFASNEHPKSSKL